MNYLYYSVMGAGRGQVSRGKGEKEAAVIFEDVEVPKVPSA